jgi:Ca-activated chloride channel family protein
MFSFAYPWLIVLLPLPWIVWRFWPRKDAQPTYSAQSSALLHPALKYLTDAYASRVPALPRQNWLPFILLSLIWLFALLALMQPQWLKPHTEARTSGYDLMLAVDLSRSMLALDFTVDGQPVNRLQVVKGVVGRFIEQRQGDRIGLILFGDTAYMQAPLTLDGSAVRRMLDSSVPRMAGDGTAIGDAIALATKHLRERPPESRVLILLTDGENTRGNLPPEQSALLANEYSIRIYTVGVGSTGEVPFPDENGRITMEKMELDENLLRKLAQSSGGAYFRATDAQALEEIYRRINELEKTEAESHTVWIPMPLFRVPLGIAMLLLLSLVILSLRRDRMSL